MLSLFRFGEQPCMQQRNMEQNTSISFWTPMAYLRLWWKYYKMSKLSYTTMTLCTLRICLEMLRVNDVSLKFRSAQLTEVTNPLKFRQRWLRYWAPGAVWSGTPVPTRLSQGLKHSTHEWLVYPWQCFQIITKISKPQFQSQEIWIATFKQPHWMACLTIMSLPSLFRLPQNSHQATSHLGKDLSLRCINPARNPLPVCWRNLVSASSSLSRNLKVSILWSFFNLRISCTYNKTYIYT